MDIEDVVLIIFNHLSMRWACAKFTRNGKFQSRMRTFCIKNEFPGNAVSLFLIVQILWLWYLNWKTLQNLILVNTIILNLIVIILQILLSLNKIKKHISSCSNTSLLSIYSYSFLSRYLKIFKEKIANSIGYLFFKAFQVITKK